MNSNNHAPSRLFWVAALVFLLPAVVFGQGSNGVINGTVSDATGAVIPGARVTIANAETGVANTVESGINGAYTLPLPAGPCTTLPSSPTASSRRPSTGCALNVASEVSYNFALEIGALTEVVEVTAEQLQVQTTSGSVGATVQVEQIQELPLPDRDIFNLVNLVPGAFRTESNGYMSIGGGRTRSTGSYIDGINNTRGGLGVQNVEMSPPVDSMQEFKVEVNSMGAKYGRSSSGVVTAVTRSGTNAWHGSLYHFMRNDAFDAAGWQNDSKPKLRRNNGGGSAGGPIVKNKTFIFYNLDVFRQAQGAIRTRSVGLPEWRNGNFSTATQNQGGQAVLVPIHDPETRTAGPRHNALDSEPFPNNAIPSSRFDPVAVKALGFLPNPNRTPNNLNNNSGNWREQTSNRRNRDYHTFKLDHNFSDKYRSFLRMILTSPDDTLTGYSQGYGVADQNGLDILNVRQNWGWSQTYTFSPTFFVTGLVGFNRVTVDRKSGDCCETNYAQQFGIPGLEKGGEVFPRFNIQGGRVPVNQFGAAGNANRFAAFTNFDFEANFTKVSGDHTLTFGAKYTAFQGNEVSRPQPSGAWRTTGNFTRFRPSGGGRDQNTGISVADFLLGHIWNLDTRVAPGIGKRIKYYSGYVQDDWKVNPRLTLNLGLRYEVETPITEVGDRHNGFCQFCPHPLAGQNGIRPNAIGKMLFPNRDGTGKYLWNMDKNNLAPRFGFALRLREDDSLVLRGGFGIFFGNPYDRNSIQPGPRRLRQHLPLSRRSENVHARRRSGRRPGRHSGSGAQRRLRLHRHPLPDLDGSVLGSGARNALLAELQPDAADPLEGRLVGLRHNRQPGAPPVDQQHQHQPHPPRGPPGGQRPGRQRGRLPALDRLHRQPGPDSVDVAELGHLKLLCSDLQVGRSATRTALGWTIAYTHTQWIDNIRFIGDADTFGDNDNPQNIFDFANERSSSVNRLPHRIVMAPIFELPFGRGRKWGGSWNKIVDGMLGGWQLATVGMLRSGGYMGVTVDGGPNLRGDVAAAAAESYRSVLRGGQPGTGGGKRHRPELAERRRLFGP